MDELKEQLAELLDEHGYASVLEAILSDLDDRLNDLAILGDDDAPAMAQLAYRLRNLISELHHAKANQ